LVRIAVESADIVGGVEGTPSLDISVVKIVQELARFENSFFGRILELGLKDEAHGIADR
jgi:hypothetical protein